METRFIKKHQIIGKKLYKQMAYGPNENKVFGVLFFGDGSVLVQDQENIKMVATMSYPYFLKVTELGAWVEIENEVLEK